MKKKFCSECGNIVNVIDGKCEFCGNELSKANNKSSLKICPECGSLVYYDKEFGYVCDFCSCDLNEIKTHKDTENSI